MSEAGNLKQVAKGGALFTLGTISSYLLKLVIGIIVIRYIAVSEYGMISFGYVLANIAVVFATLGLKVSIPRLIAHKRQDGSGIGTVNEISGTSLTLIAACSLLTAILLYIFSGKLSETLDKPELSFVLQVFSFMVMPLALLQGLTSVFQGNQRVKPKVLFEDIAVHVSRLILVAGAIILSLESKGVLYAYVGSVWIGFLLFSFYALQQKEVTSGLGFNRTLLPGILLFSLPLFGVGIIGNLTGWVGAALLGYYQSADEVAMFMAPSRLQMLLLAPMTALMFIYAPLATKLFAGKNLYGLSKLYVSSTKWVAVLTIPLALYFIIDAEYIVTLLFGEKYINASIVLQIMAVGYVVHSLTGPNMATLIACGYPKFAFYGSAIAAGASITIGMVTVPSYGAPGAAVATGTALVLSNIFSSLALYLKVGIHPFRERYGVVLASLALVAVMSGVLSHQVLSDSHIHHALLFIFMYVASLVIYLTGKNLNSEDIEMLSSIERKMLGGSMLVSRFINYVKKK